jgi:hypothetical protein
VAYLKKLSLEKQGKIIASFFLENGISSECYGDINTFQCVRQATSYIKSSDACSASLCPHSAEYTFTQRSENKYSLPYAQFSTTSLATHQNTPCSYYTGFTVLKQRTEFKKPITITCKLLTVTKTDFSEGTSYFLRQDRKSHSYG